MASDGIGFDQEKWSVMNHEGDQQKCHEPWRWPVSEEEGVRAFILLKASPFIIHSKNYIPLQMELGTIHIFQKTKKWASNEIMCVAIRSATFMDKL